MSRKRWKQWTYRALATALVVTSIPISGFTAKAAAPEALQAQFGTPKIDGVVDEIWANATAYAMEQPDLLEGTSGTTKVMWDDNALYILSEVVDGNLDSTAGDAYQQDSVEVFLDELYDKATSYQNDDVHYRVNYQNVRSTDNGDPGRFYTAVSTTETGYVVEACIRFVNVTPVNDMELGFDTQINACAGGSRSGTLNIFDSTGNAYADPSLLGKLVLAGKGAESTSGAFPYSLMTYLEQVDAMELSIYTEASAAVVTAKVAEANALLAGGSYTQEQVDAAYDAIGAAINALDDGSGFTSPANLPASAAIPNVLQFADGSAVTAQNWADRAAEIKSLYDYYMYGPMPDTSAETVTYSISELTDSTKEITLPDGTKTTVAARTGDMTITVSRDGKSSSFKVLVALPTTEAPEGGYPVFTELSASMNFGGWWVIPVSISDNSYYAASRGYASFTYDAGEVASDDSGRTGAFYTLYPYGKSWQEQTGALVAWGWGIGKILDALEVGAATDLNINAENNILGGVSRYGKATAVAGAYDDRIKVVVPACSGAGGMAMYRYQSQGKTYDLSEFGYVNDEGTSTHLTGDNEHLGSLQSNDEGHWFNDNFKKFSSVQQFPMDQHFLASLVADPDRYLFIVNGVVGEDWTNPEAMSLTYAAAKEVYDMLGIGDNINISVHLEGHSINMSDMVALLDYCDVKLYGKAPADVETDLRDVKTSVYLNQDNYNAEVFGPYVTNDLTDVDEESLVGLKFAVPCESTYEVIKQKLPATVDIYVDTIRRIDAPVTWDVENCGYDATSKETQNLTVNGTVSLPAGILNPDNISLQVQASVIVTNLVSYGSDIVDGAVGNDYTQAESYKAENILSADAQSITTDDGKADITFMWDEAFLYVMADVTDSDVYTAAGKGEQEDSISLTIAKDLTVGKDVKNYCITAGGDAYVVGVDTSGWTAAKTYTAAEGVYADAEKTDTGYRIEACFTWEELGITPGENQVMAMEAIVNSCSTAKEGCDFMRAVSLTAYPENIETYKWWGFMDVQYNAGLYADDLTAFSLATKKVSTVAEDIGRYSLIKFADAFYDNYVKPFPLQSTYDAQKVADAKSYALSTDATKEGIAEQEQILRTMADTLSAENYDGKLMTQRGTPVVDGKGDDALWENAYVYKTNVAADGQYAEIRTLWDDEATYALVKVYDPTFDVTGSDAHTKDSVEFFFLTTEDSDANSFGKNGGQWRINRANQVTVTFGMNEPFYAKATEMADGQGYIVEARLDFADDWDISHESVMNFDVAVNLCANGGRTEAVAWTSGDCYSNPNTAGEMVYLETSAGESVVPNGYNPYALIKVLDKALVMKAADYDAEDFAAHYNKALLQKYYDEAIAGKLTAEQIESYYDSVIEMMSKITYDGVHKSALGFEADHNLPDPFTMADGSIVQTEEDWAERHEEIQDLYEFYMYGKLPVAEETGLTKSFAVDAEDSSTFNINLSRGDVQKSFSFKVYMPEGTAPEGGWPYIINYGGNIGGAQDAGYAVIDYNSNGDVASASSLYTGVFYDLYPECKGDNYAIGVGHLAARAWGAGLIIDCIEAGTGDLSKLDPAKSAVTGFSYLGKTALVTGVLEERIAVTNPAHSGIGGAALLRYTSQGKKYLKSEYPMDMDDEYFLTTKTEPIGQAQGQGALWVKSIFSDFIGSDSTPFDTHMLLSLVAPRGLFVSSGYFDNGTDPEGMYGAYLGAQKVYQFLDAEGNIVYADFPTSHATSDAETQAFLQYLDYYFYGTELPDGFRDTVYDNSPDKAEYDVIKVPVKQTDLMSKVDTLEEQIADASAQKTQTANEVLDMLKEMAESNHMAALTKAELSRAETTVAIALDMDIAYAKSSETLPTVEHMIGAVLNGQAGDTLALALDTVAAGDRPAIDSKYNTGTAVVFDMKLLKNAGAIQPVAPITVRMQVPAGIDKSKAIKVLHYAAGATTPEVLEVSVTDNLMEFEVDGFSTFVVVNMADAPSGGGNSGDSGSGSVGDASQGGNGSADQNQGAAADKQESGSKDKPQSAVGKEQEDAEVKEETAESEKDAEKEPVKETEKEPEKDDAKDAEKDSAKESEVADKESGEEKTTTDAGNLTVDTDAEQGNSMIVIIIVVIAAVVVIGGAILTLKVRKGRDE